MGKGTENSHKRTAQGLVLCSVLFGCKNYNSFSHNSHNSHTIRTIRTKFAQYIKSKQIRTIRTIGTKFAQSIVESSRLLGQRRIHRGELTAGFWGWSQPCHADVILEAIRLLKEVVVPDEGTPHSEYRVSATIGFLYKFLLLLGEENSDGMENSEWEDLADRKSTISGTVFVNQQENGSSECGKRLSSHQEIEEGVDFRLVGQAVKKVGAESRC